MAQVEEVKILQVDTTKSVNAVRELRKSMKDLDSAFISGTISEEEYMEQTKQLESQMFAVTDAHKDAKLSINDFGVQMKNVATVGKSVTGALTGIQAGMNALGLESSGIAEQISKLQNLQALTEAFGALKDDGVKAFNGLKDALGSATKGLSGFKKALIGTGIGAIVVAIGLLIANFDELNNWIKNVTGGALDLTKVFDGLKGIFENIGPTLKSFGNLVLQYLLAPFRTVIDTATGLGNIFQNLFKGDFDGVKKAAEDMSSNIKSNFTAIGDAAKDFGSTVAEGYTNGVKNAEEKATQSAKEEAAKKAEEYKKQQVELLNQRKATLDAELAYQKASHDKEWSSSQEYKDKLESYYDELLGLYSKTYGEDSLEYKKILTEKLTSLRDFVTNEEQAIIDANEEEEKQNDKRKALLKSLSDYEKGEQQAKLDDLKAKYEEDLQLLGDNLDAKKLLEQRYKEEVDAINEKYKQPDEEQTEEDKGSVFSTIKDELAETQELLSGFDTPFSEATNSILSELSVLTVGFDSLKKKIDEGGATWGDYAAVAGASISSVGNMIGALAEMQDTTTEEGFEKSKKMQIAAATMNMLGGLISTWASAMNPANAFMTIWGQIAMGAAQSAAILGLGIANIQKIKQSTLGGGSTAGSTSLSVPQLNVAAAADIANSSLNTREIISDSEAQSNLEATKVYVTESDIASTTKKVQTVESENTL